MNECGWSCKSIEYMTMEGSRSWQNVVVDSDVRDLKGIFEGA